MNPTETLMETHGIPGGMMVNVAGSPACSARWEHSGIPSRMSRGSPALESPSQRLEPRSLAEKTILEAPEGTNKLTEGLRWDQPPCSTRSPQGHWSGLCPQGFWVPEEKETPPPLQAACSRPQPPTQFSSCSGGMFCCHLLPFASDPAAQHPREILAPSSCRTPRAAGPPSHIPALTHLQEQQDDEQLQGAQQDHGAPEEILPCEVGASRCSRAGAVERCVMAPCSPGPSHQHFQPCGQPHKTTGISTPSDKFFVVSVKLKWLQAKLSPLVLLGCFSLHLSLPRTINGSWLRFYYYFTTSRNHVYWFNSSLEMPIPNTFGNVY